jgi:hypothetical protein
MRTWLGLSKTAEYVIGLKSDGNAEDAGRAVASIVPTTVEREEEQQPPTRRGFALVATDVSTKSITDG